MTSYDEIFTTEESRAEARREKIQEIPLSELQPFKDHPFRVVDDERMMETVESVRERTRENRIVFHATADEMRLIEQRMHSLGIRNRRICTETRSERNSQFVRSDFPYEQQSESDRKANQQHKPALRRRSHRYPLSAGTDIEGIENAARKD